MESFNIKNTVPSTLTEAYNMSLSKSFRREVEKLLTAAKCSHIQFYDLPSLWKCNHTLADTIINVSKLAFDSLAAYDLNLTLYGSKLKLAQTQFSLKDLHSYLPFGEAYDLLSSHYLISHELDMPVTELSFPHFVIQEFWAAFYVAVAANSISDFEQHAYRSYLYFTCGMCSSNSTMLHHIFKVILENSWPGLDLLNVAAKCGVESGHSDILVATYLHLHGTTFNVGNLMPYSSEVQSFVHMIHSNITQIDITQNSSSLRLYVKNISDPFPNLSTVTLVTAANSDDKYFDDLRDNLKLISSWQRSLLEIQLAMSVDLLIDQRFLNLLRETFSLEVKEVLIYVYGSLVSKVPKDLDIFVNCSSQLQYFDHAVDLNPQILITALENVNNCFNKVDNLVILISTPVTLLNFHYVTSLFISLQKSSFYTVLQILELKDISYAMTYENKMKILLCDSKCCKYILHRTFSDLSLANCTDNQPFYTFL